MQATPPLAPSFWRSCRVLANAARLRLLANIDRNGIASVVQTSRREGLSQPQVTQHLRLLQSRGLLQAERVGRHVFYHARADASVVHAAWLLAAVRAAFRRGETPDGIVRALTAYTHERRIRLVQALAAGIVRRQDLSMHCSISRAALKRQLCKLERRGVIRREGADGLRLARLHPGLLRSLTARLIDPDGTRSTRRRRAA